MCVTDYKQKNSFVVQGVKARVYMVYTHTHSKGENTEMVSLGKNAQLYCEHTTLEMQVRKASLMLGGNGA